MPLAATAQTDYDFIVNRNAWLLSQNGAALTTFNDSNVVKGEVGFETGKGEECVLSKATSVTTANAEVESVYRLSEKVVVSGGISYENTTKNEHSGTAFMRTDEVLPFDITISAPGRNKIERVDIGGAVGWNVWKNVSLGAKADYTSADRARQKDLRHANSYMNLNTSVGGFCDFKSIALAAAFHYRRTTDAVAFSTAGTTDIVHVSMIDYANGLGVSETFYGDGFTDKNEQPLFSEYKGFSVQASADVGKHFKMFASGRYSHRNGFYGKESQYTLVHARHNSDCYGTRARLQYEATNSLHWIEADLNVENLTAFRTNYLSQINDGVTSYQYYDPTKLANKLRASGSIEYSGYISPLSSSLYEWQIHAGATLCNRKQTAYLYPQISTTDYSLLQPFASAKRNFQLRNKAIFGAEIGFAMQTCSGSYLADYDVFTKEKASFSIAANYEFPLKNNSRLRPNFSASYSSLHNTFSVSVGIEY